MFRIPLVPLFLVVLLLAGCSQQAPEITANEQVPADQRTEAAAEGGTEAAGGEGGGPTWVAVDIDFESAPEELSAGAVEVELGNEGSIVHNVTFEGVNNDSPVVEAQGGQTATGTVELEAGDYTYFCSVPGHQDLMRGEVTVS